MEGINLGFNKIDRHVRCYVFICGVYSGAGRVRQKIWTPQYVLQLLLQLQI